ncbi:MAG: TIGR02757 family protein [Bacteroidota bacterium]
MSPSELKDFLELKYSQYNTPDFIAEDPISIPHQFQRKEDIEIAGFFSALIAWGRRNMIIRNAQSLMERMDMAPYDFVMAAEEEDLNRLSGFVHRTFNEQDAYALVLSLRMAYQQEGGLEALLTKGPTVYEGLVNLRTVLSTHPVFPQRTHKHLANPAKGSSAKRLNMYLRWMVRSDKRGVDFGIWKGLAPSQLLCPLDVHTAKVARKLGLLTRKQNDWKAVVELTDNLKVFSPEDPVKYDFSLFGLGVYDGF